MEAADMMLAAKLRCLGFRGWFSWASGALNLTDQVQNELVGWTGGLEGLGAVLVCPIIPWITPSSPRQLCNCYPPFCGAKPNCVEWDGWGARWNPLAWGVFSPLHPECWHGHYFKHTHMHIHTYTRTHFVVVWALTAPLPLSLLFIFYFFPLSCRLFIHTFSTHHQPLFSYVLSLPLSAIKERPQQGPEREIDGWMCRKRDKGSDCCFLSITPSLLSSLSTSV